MAREKPKQGSIYDVAREAGVSIGTVSRAFNDKSGVAADTRALVLEAAKKVRYLPRISTRRINIGLVVEQMEKANAVGFISEMVATLAKHMALKGAILDLVPLHDLDAIYRNYIQGLIAIPFGAERNVLKAIRHIPVVLINSVAEDGAFHSVASDHAQGARDAVEYLLRKGHRRIGFLEVQPDTWGSRERQKGYREAFRKLGAKAPASLLRFTRHRPAREALLPLLKEKPTALLVCGEDLSIEVSQILIHELRIAIPRELSVITYENPSVSALLTPPQTTVAQPWEDIGRAAVEGILSLIKGTRREPLRVLLPNRLIRRDSVGRV